MRYLTEPGFAALEVPHGFSVREGGVSEGAWRSLNLGATVGDVPGAVEENLRRLALDVGTGAFFQVRQVHGRRVVQVDGKSELEPVAASEADALATSTAGRFVGVRTADCVPILLATADGRTVAAVHAGWRGTVARVAAAAVEFLGTTYEVAPGDLYAAVGPRIGVCCYEVDPALGERFALELGEGTVDRAGNRPHLDLGEANRVVLVEAGLDPSRVGILNRCTSCESEAFFSHRRDAGRTGRHLSFVAPRFP